jgi:hypothetical protein
MVSKFLLVSAAAGGLMLAQPQTANAGMDVNIGIGGFYGGHPSNYYDHDYDYDRISCWQGRRIVRRAGFHGVQTLRCHGDVFRYSGWKRGQLWRVSVDSDSGRIVRARIMPAVY